MQRVPTWLRANRPRHRSPKAASGLTVLTFIDQGVSSASNFITGVAVAQFSGAAQFGEYMLVLMTWIVIVGIHRRLITEPLTVTSRDSDAPDALIAQGLTAEIALGAFASLILGTTGVLAIATGSGIADTLLAMSPWFAPLLVQDYWRAVAFQRRRPGLALANDTTFAAVQLLGILAFSIIGWRSVGYIIAAWGTGALVGAALGFSWFPAVSGWREARQLVRQLWPLGRWLLADFVTAFGSRQAYLACAALVLSKADYGGFRAGVNLMGPVIVILIAAGNVGLPEASRRVGGQDLTSLRSFARRLSIVTTCCVAVYGILLAVLAKPLLRLLYGQEFVGFYLFAILAAVQYAVTVTAYGQEIVLKVTGWIRQIWPVRIVTTALSIVTLVLLVKWFGLTGAGWAGVATGAYDAIAIYLVYVRKIAKGKRAQPDAVPPMPPVSESTFSPSVTPPEGTPP